MTRLALIVPFRKRYAHLRQFIQHYKRMLNHASIYIIEQVDEKPFNRAKLLNAGFKEFHQTFDYFAAHDVDMLCTRGDYSYCQHPTQLATHAQQFKYKMPFPDYFGGVTLFNNNDFTKINGYSNEFWGYGGEDNEMYFNVKNCGLTIDYRDCFYRSLHHPPSHPEGFDRQKMEQAKLPRAKNDGLLHCKYEIAATEDLGEYIKLRIVL